MTHSDESQAKPSSTSSISNPKTTSTPDQESQPFTIFFDPEVQQLAIERQRAVDSGNQTTYVGSLNKRQKLVHRQGLEP